MAAIALRLVAYSSWSIISPLIVAKKLSATALLSREGELAALSVFLATPFVHRAALSAFLATLFVQYLESVLPW